MQDGQWLGEGGGWPLAHWYLKSPEYGGIRRRAYKRNFVEFFGGTYTYKYYTYEEGSWHINLILGFSSKFWINPMLRDHEFLWGLLIKIPSLKEFPSQSYCSTVLKGPSLKKEKKKAKEKTPEIVNSEIYVTCNLSTLDFVIILDPPTWKLLSQLLKTEHFIFIQDKRPWNRRLSRKQENKFVNVDNRALVIFKHTTLNIFSFYIYYIHAWFNTVICIYVCIFNIHSYACRLIYPAVEISPEALAGSKLCNFYLTYFSKLGAK